MSALQILSEMITFAVGQVVADWVRAAGEPVVRLQA